MAVLLYFAGRKELKILLSETGSNGVDSPGRLTFGCGSYSGVVLHKI